MSASVSSSRHPNYRPRAVWLVGLGVLGLLACTPAEAPATRSDLPPGDPELVFLTLAEQICSSVPAEGRLVWATVSRPRSADSVASQPLPPDLRAEVRVERLRPSRQGAEDYALRLSLEAYEWTGRRVVPRDRSIVVDIESVGYVKRTSETAVVDQCLSRRTELTAVLDTVGSDLR